MKINILRSYAIPGVLIFSLLFVLIAKTESASLSEKQIEIIIKPAAAGVLMTETIQQSIDKCAAEGGGNVRFIEGTYLSGTILLRSKVTLQLDKGALIKGSDKYSDYRNDAFFYAKELSDISIKGEGIIDGVDCYNAKGEEGFRGPHCIRLVSCKNITLEGITIKNSANWAINCRYCSYGNVTNVTILGGHDGLHTRFCNNFTARGCDFRTGDDAFAGNDNRDFEITDCSINTSCNGFRMGCMNLIVKRCRFWGPGEYVHKIQKRHNMLSAFVHFSPKDEKPQLQNGNWLIQDIKVENVDNFFIYNFRNGLWQTGQPFTSVRFDRIEAKGILRSFYAAGDDKLLFNMTITNSSFTFRDGDESNTESFEGAKLLSPGFFYANSFDKILLEKVAFTKRDSSLLLGFDSGNNLIMEKVTFTNLSELQPFNTNRVKEVNLEKLKHNGNDISGKQLKPIKISR